MKRYRANRQFVFSELGPWSPEDDFQRIEQGEEIGELESSVGLYIKDRAVCGIWLKGTQLAHLTMIGTASDPCSCSNRRNTP